MAVKVKPSGIRQENRCNLDFPCLILKVQRLARLDGMQEGEDQATVKNELTIPPQMSARRMLDLLIACCPAEPAPVRMMLMKL